MEQQLTNGVMPEPQLNYMPEEPIMEQERTLTGKVLEAANLEQLKEFEIRIQFLNRGCVVQVGCKSIAFETKEKAMFEINRYVDNTYEVQKEWRKILG